MTPIQHPEPEPTKEEAERLAENGPFYFQPKKIEIHVNQ